MSVCCQDNLIFRQPNKGRLAIPIQVPYIEELYSLVLLIHVSYLFAHRIPCAGHVDAALF